MVRIRNWKRIRSARHASWEHTKKSNRTVHVERLKTAAVAISEVLRSEGKLNASAYAPWIAWAEVWRSQGGNMILWEQKYPTEQEAMAAAVNYMRRHANG